MEFLETFGCIWSSKEVFKVIIGRAAHGSDQSGATPSSRSDLPIGATLPERQGGVARVFITRRRENKSGATSPERHHQVALISLSERPYQSDREESLVFSSPGDARTSPERPLAATQRVRIRVPLNLKEVEPENLESTVVPDGFLCTLEWVEIKEVTIV
uniref:Uncharacterized protein n=1 Tax=Brassica oleracea var. oleracea TaxID=109376 RepID=A0A0D3ASV1_BRAOL